jgi:transcriptional regulator of met regulon
LTCMLLNEIFNMNKTRKQKIQLQHANNLNLLLCQNN